MGEATCASDLAKKVNVLDAIKWLKSAWDSVQVSIIQKCFAKCSFFVSHPTEKGPTITDEMDSTFDFVTVQCHLCMIITPLANIIIHHLLFIVSCTPSPITNPLVHTQRDLQMAT